MGAYLTKPDYSYIVKKFKDSIHPDGFICIQKSGRVNVRMCPCISKNYLQNIGEVIINCINPSVKLGTNNDLDSLSCSKENKMIGYDQKNAHLAISRNYLKNINSNLLFSFAISIEIAGINDDEKKSSLLNRFFEFLTKGNTYNDIKNISKEKLIINDEIKNHNCKFPKRNSNLMNCLFIFMDTYLDENEPNGYYDFINIIITMLSRLNVEDDNSANTDIDLYKKVEKTFIDMYEENQNT